MSISGKLNGQYTQKRNELDAPCKGLPYQRYPKVLMKGVVDNATRCLNQLPAEDGLSYRISPMSLVTGIGPIYYNKLITSMGVYGQAFEDNNPTNTNAPRSVRAIALSMSLNENGYFTFMSLDTGKKINRRKFTELPITEAVIKRVEFLAEEEGQPKSKMGALCSNGKSG